MGRKAKLSVEKQAVIVALHKEGYSTRKIASKTNFSQNAVMRALQRKRETGCNQSHHCSGMPRVTLNHKDKFICVQSKRNCTQTTHEICQELNSILFEP